MAGTIMLSTDGPQAVSTLRAAGMMAAAVRVLAYATRTGEGIGDDPANACELVGAVYEATGGLPQVLRQLASWLALAGPAMVSAAEDGDVPAATVAARDALDVAAGLLPAVTRALQDAQNALADLYIPGEAGEGSG